MTRLTDIEARISNGSTYADTDLVLVAKSDLDWLIKRAKVAEKFDALKQELLDIRKNLRQSLGRQT